MNTVAIDRNQIEQLVRAAIRGESAVRRSPLARR